MNPFTLALFWLHFVRPYCRFFFKAKIFSRRDRDAELFKLVAERVKSGGDVLLPVDPAGRVLELLVLLHQLWYISILMMTHYNSCLYGNNWWLLGCITS